MSGFLLENDAIIRSWASISSAFVFIVMAGAPHAQTPAPGSG
jgi:hypothetical protein